MGDTKAWEKEADLGNRIRLLRQSKKLTQRAFEHFGIKQSYLANLEKGGITNPSPDMLSNIAKRLEISVEKLIEGTPLSKSYQATLLPHKSFCPKNDCPKLALNRLATGMIIPYRFSIQRVQTSGKDVYEARYCPYCGSELLTGCPNCGKPILIDDPQQVHCVHCGKQLFDPITEEDMRAKGLP